MSSKSKKGGSAPAEEISVSTEEVSSVVRTIGVTVPRSRVASAFDRTYRDLARTASVRGFRKGKVPRSVLENLYGASIPQEIERVLVQETIQDAIERSGLEPLIQPEVEAGDPSADQDFEFTLRVEVKPEIELPDLDGLPAKAPAVRVDDDEVTAELDRMREANAPLIEEDEDAVVADGHTITFDYEGSVDGELFEGGKAEGVDLEIGSGRMIPGFEEGLLGARAGESPTLTVTFPDEYQAEHLAGKEASFACTVHTIKKRQVPELDDEFAKDVGEYESLDELRDKVRGDFTTRRENERKSAIERSAMDSLLERCEFDVPPGIVERQLEHQIQQMAQQFQGQIPPDILNQQLARMREDGRDAAERRVRESFVLEALVKASDIEVGDEDVEARYVEMAESQGMEVEQVKQMAQAQGWGDAIRAEIMDGKALAFLVAKATVEDLVEEAEEADETD
ncbi:MAG: trigger factor [Myxococcota bacterium]|nr:trigger factor [Myxococcota bacterium]